MARRTVLLATVAFILLPGISLAQTKRALLIGINTYQLANVQWSQQQGPTGGRFALAALPNLEGALNDVQAMRDLLASPKFGFPKDRVFILPEKDATHDGIVSAMRKYLVDEPQRGDTVVFMYPQEPRKSYIKRVIGLPGDRIRIVSGQVFVNGRALVEDYVPKGYRDTVSWPPGAPGDAPEERQVPAGEYFVLGDHRSSSSDSRSWGWVPRDNIFGKAVFIYWPPDKIGRLR